MKRPVRTTLVYGAISALAVMPAAVLLSAYVDWPSAVKLALWADLAAYAVLMARWSGKPLTAIMFPLALLLGTALWPGLYSAFFFLGAGVLSWLRSGICFSSTPMRAMAAETVSIAGGAGLVVLLGPGTTVTWAVSIWLFFLVQALYFFIVSPVEQPTSAQTPPDPFAQAQREALRVLDDIG
jgi:hypothetical protein